MPRVAGLNLIITTIILRMHTISISLNRTAFWRSRFSRSHVLTEISIGTHSRARARREWNALSAAEASENAYNWSERCFLFARIY